MPDDKKKLTCEDGYKLQGENCVMSYITHDGPINIGNDSFIFPDSCLSTAVYGDNTVTCSHPAKPASE